MSSPMDIEAWGKSGWNLLHAISFKYPVSDASKIQREAFYSLLSGLGYVLPCESCRAHLREYLNDPGTGITGPDSSHLDTRESISRWMVGFHNDVNTRIGKPVMTYAAVEELYRNVENACPMSPSGRRMCSGDDKGVYYGSELIFKCRSNKLVTALSALFVVSVCTFTYFFWKHRAEYEMRKLQKVAEANALHAFYVVGNAP